MGSCVRVSSSAGEGVCPPALASLLTSSSPSDSMASITTQSWKQVPHLPWALDAPSNHLRWPPLPPRRPSKSTCSKTSLSSFPTNRFCLLLPLWMNRCPSWPIPPARKRSASVSPWPVDDRLGARPQVSSLGLLRSVPWASSLFPMPPQVCSLALGSVPITSSLVLHQPLASKLPPSPWDEAQTLGPVGWAWKPGWAPSSLYSPSLTVPLFPPDVLLCFQSLKMPSSFLPLAFDPATCPDRDNRVAGTMVRMGAGFPQPCARPCCDTPACVQGPPARLLPAPTWLEGKWESLLLDLPPQSTRHQGT